MRGFQLHLQKWPLKRRQRDGVTIAFDVEIELLMDECTQFISCLYFLIVADMQPQVCTKSHITCYVMQAF